MAGLLLLLPTELRLQIYKYLWQTDDHALLVHKSYDLSSQLLRASRTTYSEYLPLIYGEHTFSELTKQPQWHNQDGQEVRYLQANLVYFLSRVGSAAASCIRSVELQQNWDYIPWHGPEFCLGFEALTGLEKVKIHVFYTGQASEGAEFDATAMSEKLVRQTIFGSCGPEHETGRLFAPLVARINQSCEWEVVFELSDYQHEDHLRGYKDHQIRSRVMFTSLSGIPILDGSQACGVIESRTRERKFQFWMVPHTGIEYSEWTLEKTIGTTDEEIKVEVGS